jgi:hypothetical protein
MTEFTVPILVLDRPTSVTGRVFPRSIGEEFVRDINAGKNGLIVDFPQDTTTVDLSRIAGRVKNARIEGDTIVADITLLETPMGQIVSTLRDSQVQLRYSLNCVGNVDAEGQVFDASLISVSVVSDHLTESSDSDK